MFRKILTTAAALGLLAGAASVQAAPSAAGLTPGVPVGSDANDNKIVAGER